MSSHTIERLTWESAHNRVETVNPKLAELLTRKSRRLTKKQKCLFSARYPYGSMLVRKGHFCLPDSTPHDATRAECESSVGYSRIPLALVINNCVEVYVERHFNPLNLEAGEHRSTIVVPLRILKKGELFGVFEVVDVLTFPPPSPSVPWEVSSGARTVHLLAPFADEKKIDAINVELGTSLSKNDIKEDSWRLLRSVASRTSPQWHAEVLLFPKQWIMGDDVDSRCFREHLYRLAWEQSINLRDAGVAESQVSEVILSLRNTIRNLGQIALLHIPPNLRHLVAIGMGTAIAFEPLAPHLKLKRYELGPFGECQEFLLNHKYKGETKSFQSCPVILQPCHLRNSGDVGYYSISRPSLFGPPLEWKRSLLAGFVLPFAAVISKIMRSKDPAIAAFRDHTTLDWCNLIVFGDGVKKHFKRRPSDPLCEILKDRIELHQELLSLNTAPVQKTPFSTACVKLVRR